MGIFGDQVNLNKAKVSGGGIYFLPVMTKPADKVAGTPPEYGTGRYEATVEVVKIHPARSGKQYFLAEFVINSSNNPLLPAKTRCSYMIDLAFDAAPGNIKALMCALSGLDPNGSKDAQAIADEDWDAAAETAVEPEDKEKGTGNPMKGDKCIVEVFYRLKKGKKIDPSRDKALNNDYYTHHVFYPTAQESK